MAPKRGDQRPIEVHEQFSTLRYLAYNQEKWGFGGNSASKKQVFGMAWRTQEMCIAARTRSSCAFPLLDQSPLCRPPLRSLGCCPTALEFTVFRSCDTTWPQRHLVLGIERWNAKDSDSSGASHRFKPLQVQPHLGHHHPRRCTSHQLRINNLSRSVRTRPRGPVS